MFDPAFLEGPLQPRQVVAIFKESEYTTDTLGYYGTVVLVGKPKANGGRTYDIYVPFFKRVMRYAREDLIPTTDVDESKLPIA